MNYKSISVRKLYAIAAVLTAVYVILSAAAFLVSDFAVNFFAGDYFAETHPDIQIKLMNKIQIIPFIIIIWIPYFKYVTGCMELGFSEKRCRKTFKAAPAYWVLGFIGEHVFISFKAITAATQSESWIMQRTEYVCFLFCLLNIASLVIVCTSAALGMDEIRHVDHMK